MTPSTPDDGFHEIQLNGKQLVFLFMAATVVSVVIFLCGVLVGRGVRAERGSSTDASVSGDQTPGDITPTPAATPQATPTPAASPTESASNAPAAPPPPPEDLSYFKRLEDPKQPPETIKPQAKTAPARAAAPTQAPTAGANAANGADPSAAPKPAPKSNAAAPVAAPKETAAAPSTSADLQPPAAPGYAVQVAALSVRGDADNIAKHLASKGYPAYVAANGSPMIYRVRIGAFKTRREAETIAAKLQKEEQLKPFVTR